jgi:predicted glycoside hydrolase/deacetylase ChbG (UPF0249 family)
VRILFLIILSALVVGPGFTHAQDAPKTEIRLIVRGDDMGAAQAINEGCIEAFKEGLVRSVEVIVPGPWYLDAVRLLKDNADLDVGVHLTLTSEWDNLKWRPLTAGKTLVDANGYFHPTTAGFVAANPDAKEVEAELRAQIETAKRHLGARITHVSFHIDTANATPELAALTQKLAKEYKLHTGAGLERTAGFGSKTSTSDQREKALLALLEKLQAGDWLLVEHPAYDTPETGRLGHEGYTNVSTDRSNVRRALTSDRVKALIKKRGIQLIGYNPLK